MLTVRRLLLATPLVALAFVGCGSDGGTAEAVDKPDPLPPAKQSLSAVERDITRGINGKIRDTPGWEVVRWRLLGVSCIAKSGYVADCLGEYVPQVEQYRELAPSQSVTITVQFDRRDTGEYVYEWEPGEPFLP